MSCQKCLDLHKKLDERNEATKCWIQSDTQCRDYANKLERKYEEALAVIEAAKKALYVMPDGTFRWKLADALKDWEAGR